MSGQELGRPWQNILFLLMDIRYTELLYASYLTHNEYTRLIKYFCHWLGQSRGIHVIYVFHLCFRNDYFKMNDHDLFLWSFKCHKLFTTWPITDTYMYVWYKKKIEILKTIFLLFSLAFQVEEELERILKFKKESYRTSRTNAF